MAKGVIKIGPAVVSFPNLFKATENQNGVLKYQTVLLFKGGEAGRHGEQLKKLKQAGKAVLKEKFPDGKVPKGMGIPFKKVEDGEPDYNGYEDGDEFVRFDRLEEFGTIPIVGPDRRPLTQADVYPGIEGIVACRPYVHFHTKSGNWNLKFGLEGFQKVRDGERLGGFAPVEAEDVFDELEIEEEPETPEKSEVF